MLSAKYKEIYWLVNWLYIADRLFILPLKKSDNLKENLEYHRDPSVLKNDECQGQLELFPFFHGQESVMTIRIRKSKFKSSGTMGLDALGSNGNYACSNFSSFDFDNCV